MKHLLRPPYVFVVGALIVIVVFFTPIVAALWGEDEASLRARIKACEATPCLPWLDFAAPGYQLAQPLDVPPGRMVSASVPPADAIRQARLDASDQAGRPIGVQARYDGRGCEDPTMTPQTLCLCGDSARQSTSRSACAAACTGGTGSGADQKFVLCRGGGSLSLETSVPGARVRSR